MQHSFNDENPLLSHDDFLKIIFDDQDDIVSGREEQEFESEHELKI